MRLSLPNSAHLKLRLFRSIKFLGVALVISGLLLSPGIAKAHDLEVNHGYTAVLHLDPDDDPLAGQPSVLNFFMGKAGASFNQNDYKVSIDISSAGKRLQHSNVAPRVFGDASDGVVNYTFPRIAVYKVDLYGVLKADNSPQFHMSYTVRVADAVKGYSPPASVTDPAVLGLIGSSAAVLIFVGFVTIRSARRYVDRRR